MLNLLLDLPCPLWIIPYDVSSSLLQQLNDLFVSKHKLDICDIYVSLMELKVLLEHWRHFE